MTELTDPEPTAAQPSPDWPDIGYAGVTDPVVAQALARLESLTHAPVASHEDMYNELHDELLAALNAVPTNSAAKSTDPKGGAA